MGLVRHTCVGMIASCLIVAGCSTTDATRSQDDRAIAERTAFWQPHLLYLLASPHPRLYVEVDAVKGCMPNEATLDKLRNFLARYCDKPEGIEVVRDDVIPTAAARGIPPKSLVHGYLDGPPDAPDGPAPAFMYIFFYRGALSDKPTEAGISSAAAADRPRERDVHPHADLLPYPAVIFVNTDYEIQWTRNVMLSHEAGHLLGVARQPPHASGLHCLNSACLMHRWLDLGQLLLGRQEKLCGRCEAEMAENSRLPAPSNLRFVGPVLVRSEAGYHVLSLPRFVQVLVGDLTEQDCRDFAAEARAETPSPNDRGKLHLIGTVKDEVRGDATKMGEIVARAKGDPYEVVREIASLIEAGVKPTCDP